MTIEQAEAEIPIIKRSTNGVLITSCIIAVLMGIASSAGLFYQSTVYPTDELVNALVPTDVTILFIGLPLLLVSIWLARNDKLIGLLLWPGVLLFTLYCYLNYVLSGPFSPFYMLYLVVLALCVYTLIAQLTCLDSRAVKVRLQGAVPERFAGGVLAVLGAMFVLRAAAILTDYFLNDSLLTGVEIALNSTDILISPVWVIGGILLWRRRSFGYVSGLGLLFQGMMLFVGLIFVMLITPILKGGVIPVFDIVVVLLMSLVCLIPMALYTRGVLKKKGSG